MKQTTNEEDTLTKFWSDIQNVKNATAEDIQNDILAYLKQMGIYKSKVEEMQKTINEFPISCRLDEDIPDDDKEAAYKMGYADAIMDISESIKALKGVTHEQSN